MIAHYISPSIACPKVRFAPAFALAFLTLAPGSPVLGAEKKSAINENIIADISLSSRQKTKPVVATGVQKYGLTRKDFAQIKSTVPDIKSAVPVRRFVTDARVHDRVVKTGVVGTVHEFETLFPMETMNGRFLMGNDDRKRNNVAVLSKFTAEKLFPLQNPVGKNVRLKNQYFLVVGVVDPIPRDSKNSTISKEHMIFVPLTTMRSRFGDLNVTRQEGTFQMELCELTEIHISVNQPSRVQSTAAVISRLLKSGHEKEDFVVDLK